MTTPSHSTRSYRRHGPALVFLVSLACLAAGCDAPPFARPAPRLATSHMAWADRHIEQAVADGQIPGAVLCVVLGQKVVYHKAYGYRSLQPTKEAMTRDTIFDLASITKPVATATSIMLLVERGQIHLDAPVARYLPDFAAHGKENITIADLLLHQGGITPANPLSDYEGTRAEAIARILALPPTAEPGTTFQYTCLGYIILSEVVRAVDGRPLDKFAREEIFQPLGMDDTTFNPPPEWRPRCAPTEQRNGEWIRGEVHDPRAYALGGISGNAGLFGTAGDLARYARMLLAGGSLEGRRVLSPATVREMTRPRCLPDGTDCRTYGFDVETSFSSARGDLFEPGTTYGHTGFTGTMLWIDPAREICAILLTNRVHPDGQGSWGYLRRSVMAVVAAAVEADSADRCEKTCPAASATRTRARPTTSGSAEADVLCGIDVLARDGYRALAGKRVALLTNHTGRDRQGRRTIDLLATAPEVELVKLFSPEHGLEGRQETKVADSVDSASALKVYSLYGQTRRPTDEMMADIDAVVFDIQDIGARFYTYVGTLGFVLEQAVRHDVEVIVLDRPNPITGTRVDGPVYDGDERTLVAYGPLPVMHGMTVGELARYFNSEYDIGCKLTVIEMVGWRRSMWFDQTGLMWVNPSPNMRNLTQAIVYPGICLLERTNVSVGRGTDQPFELFGAPWIDGRALAAKLNAAELPGVRFVPLTFTPTTSRFADETCQGVYVLVTDRDRIEPVRMGLTVAATIRDLHGSAFEIDGVNRLLGNARVMKALKQGREPATLPALWQSALEAFRAARARYLLYS